MQRRIRLPFRSICSAKMNEELLFLVRRLVGTLFVVLGIVLSVFLLPRLSPIDPCLAVLGSKATAAQLAQCRAEHFLDRPLTEQFTHYIGGLIQGDLGTSIRTGHPVTVELARPLAATIELALAGLCFTLLFGIGPGMLAANYHNRWPDWFVRGFTLLGNGLPVFLLALVLKELFHSHLQWLPRTGRTSDLVQPAGSGFYVLESLFRGDLQASVNNLHYLVLPAMTLGITFSANLIRVLRIALLDALATPYVLAARARGCSQRCVLLRHALRNALNPTLTVFGLTAGHLLSGTVLTEFVFSWPGIGTYAIEAARHNDFPAVTGVALIAAVVYPLTYLGVEVLQRWAMPMVSDGE